MVLIFAVGCGYFWWQAHLLTGQVATLQTKLADANAQMARVRHDRSARLGRGSHDWLAEGKVHFERARAALDDRDFGIAQREAKLSTDDYQRAAGEPVQATQNGLAEARQAIAALESKMKSVVSQ